MIDKRELLQEEFSLQLKAKELKGICNICPRFGKIKMILKSLDKKDNVLIAYPKTEIAKSWKDDVKLWKYKGKKFDYTTFMSFKKVRKNYDVLIIDEIHELSEANIKSISDYIKLTQIKKVIGLSGTINKDTELNLLYKLGLPILINYSLSQAISDEVITDYRITVQHCKLDTTKNILVKMKKGGEFYTSEYEQYHWLSYKIEQESNPLKLKMLRLRRLGVIKKSKSKVELTKKVLNDLKDKRVLVFCGLIDISNSLGIDTYHSKNKNDDVKNKFINGEIDKLAVVKQLSTGITFKSLDHCIINSFDSNSEGMAQRISRITCKEYYSPGKIANIIIICTDEIQEKLWLSKALSFFSPDKITYL